jgi:hypothetical protein
MDSHILVYNNAEGIVSGTLGAPNAAAYVPAGGITRAAGEALIASLTNGPVTATLELFEGWKFEQCGLHRCSPRFGHCWTRYQ